MPSEMTYGVVPLRRTAAGVWEVLLLLHSKGSYWGFPKGHSISPEEEPREAAARELFEETALTLERFLDFEPLCEEYAFSRDKVPVEKSVVFFPAIVEGEPVVDGKEILKARWLPIDQAVGKLTFDGTRALLLSLVPHLL